MADQQLAIDEPGDEDQTECSEDASLSDSSDVNSASVSDDPVSDWEEEYARNFWSEDRRITEIEQKRNEKRRAIHNTKWLLDDKLDWNSQLCEACQRWNACKPDMSNTVDFDSLSMMHRCKPVEEILSKGDCILCKAFQPAIREKINSLSAGQDDPAPLYCVNTGPYYFSDPENKGFRKACRVAKTIKCDFLLLIDAAPETALEHGRSMMKFNGVLFPNDLPYTALILRLRLHYESEDGGMMTVKHRDLTHLDTSSVRNLLAHCETSHSDCQSEDSLLPHGFRLIDIQDMCIVQPRLKRTISFAALSYVWSAVQDAPIILRSDNLREMFKKAGLATMTLPSLLKDAFVFCSDLGIRYVWVDRLCILQDDPKDLNMQVDAMDQIYSAANVTIVAAANASLGARLPGVARNNGRVAVDTARWKGDFARMVGHTADDVIWSSRWNKRGWTFQERELSRRCIYICDHRCYYFCASGTFEEDLDDHCYKGPLSAHYEYGGAGMVQFGASWSRIRGGSLYDFDSWETRLSDYVGRSLTHESDVLRAFQGYSNHAARRLGTRIFFGLPEKWFSQALMWWSSRGCSRRDNVTIPSWSWAAWNVPWLEHDVCGRMAPSWSEAIIRLPIEFKLNSTGHSLTTLRRSAEEQHGNIPNMVRDGDFMFFASSYRAWRNSASKKQLSKESKRLKEIIAEGIPGSLVFESQAASVTIRRMNGSQPEIDIYLATIRDPDSETVVGGLADLPGLDETSWPFTSDQYIAVAIAGAGQATGWPWEEYYKASGLKPILPEEEELYEHYSVLILQPHQSHAGAYERVAIGLIWRRKWPQLRPSWETIVLA